jgi:hypothetical protein
MVTEACKKVMCSENGNVARNLLGRYSQRIKSLLRKDQITPNNHRV